MMDDLGIRHANHAYGWDDEHFKFKYAHIQKDQPLKMEGAG